MEHLHSFKDLGKSNIVKDLPKEKVKSSHVEFVKIPIEIRIDIWNTYHANVRQFRHGHKVAGKKEGMPIYGPKISDREIIETVKLAIEQLTIDLMCSRFCIYQLHDGYPIEDRKSGDASVFVITNTKTNLNVVCCITPGTDNFTLNVITVMKKPDFKIKKGQYSIKVG